MPPLGGKNGADLRPVSEPVRSVRLDFLDLGGHLHPAGPLRDLRPRSIDQNAGAERILHAGGRLPVPGDLRRQRGMDLLLHYELLPWSLIAMVVLAGLAGGHLPAAQRRRSSAGPAEKYLVHLPMSVYLRVDHRGDDRQRDGCSCRTSGTGLE